MASKLQTTPRLPGLGLTRHSPPHPNPPPAHPALPNDEPPLLPSRPGPRQRLRLAAPGRRPHLQFHGNGGQCGRDRLRKHHRLESVEFCWSRHFSQLYQTQWYYFLRRPGFSVCSLWSKYWDLDRKFRLHDVTNPPLKLRGRRVGIRRLSTHSGASNQLFYRNHPNPPEQHDDLRAGNLQQLGHHTRSSICHFWRGYDSAYVRQWRRFLGAGCRSRPGAGAAARRPRAPAVALLPSRPRGGLNILADSHRKASPDSGGAFLWPQDPFGWPQKAQGALGADEAVQGIHRRRGPVIDSATRASDRCPGARCSRGAPPRSLQTKAPSFAGRIAAEAWIQTAFTGAGCPGHIEPRCRGLPSTTPRRAN